MTPEQLVQARRSLDAAFRVEFMISLAQFVVAWCVLTAIIFSATAADAPWVMIVVLGGAGILALPVAVVDLLVVLDAVLHVLTGQSGWLLGYLQQTVKVPKVESAPLPAGRRAIVGLARVFAWAVPWRPLSIVAVSYLSRTKEVAKCVFEYQVARRAAQEALAASSISVTQETQAVVQRGRYVPQEIERSAIYLTARRSWMSRDFAAIA